MFAQCRLSMDASRDTRAVKFGGLRTNVGTTRTGRTLSPLRRPAGAHRFLPYGRRDGRSFDREGTLDGWLFIRGAILGFSIAAPVGPIGVLCIRRTLAEGRVVGLLSGLGAATADACYGSVAAFGLTAISRQLMGHQDALRLVGGIFLLYLGLRTFLATPVQSIKSGQRSHLLGNYLSTLGLTLTNPTTIF